MYEPLPLAPHLEAFTDVLIAKHDHADPQVIAALERRMDELDAAHERINRITGKETRYEPVGV